MRGMTSARRLGVVSADPAYAIFPGAGSGPQTPPAGPEGAVENGGFIEFLAFSGVENWVAGIELQD